MRLISLLTAVFLSIAPALAQSPLEPLGIALEGYQPVDEVLNWPSTHNMSRLRLRRITLCSGLIAEQRLRQRAVECAMRREIEDRVVVDHQDDRMPRRRGAAVRDMGVHDGRAGDSPTVEQP